MAAISSMITGAAAVGGLGMSVFGGVTAMGGAKDAAAAQQQIVALEMQMEAQRKKAMELDARRRTLEIVRAQQRARSLALSTATAQNAQLGSGLQGGFAQIQQQGGFDTLGINQQLQIGRAMFGIQSGISEAKIALAGAQGQMAMGQGMMSMGGSIMNSLGQIKSLAGGFGPSSNQTGFNYAQRNNYGMSYRLPGNI